MERMTEPGLLGSPACKNSGADAEGACAVVVPGAAGGVAGDASQAQSLALPMAVRMAVRSAAERTAGSLPCSRRLFCIAAMFLGVPL